MMPVAQSSTSPEQACAVFQLAQLCIAEGVPLWQASPLIERVGSAMQILEQPPEPVNRWEAEVLAAARLPGPADRRKSELELGRDLDRWLADGLRITTVLDADYPLNLRYIYDRPPFLFYRGELRPDDAFAVAVVGARNPSHDGRARARKMARLLAEAGVTVLSGLAKGIDAEAHTATLEAGGRTIAVLGSGLYRIYPKENAALAEAIAEHGAVVSQFFPKTPPTRGTFPLRNSVTSGLGQGSIVIEASATSGARMQARLATEHGKRAVLVSSLVEEHEWARDFAQREGVVVISDVDEVLDLLARPDELWERWVREGDSIRAANAQPPELVQERLGRGHRRLRDVAVAGQAQLPL
jgi:DNA processing protein